MGQDQVELVQRLTRIETMCEGRCASSKQTHDELRELRSDMKELNGKVDAGFLAITEKHWSLKVKIVAMSSLIGGAAGYLFEKITGGK